MGVALANASRRVEERHSWRLRQDSPVANGYFVAGDGEQIAAKVLRDQLGFVPSPPWAAMLGGNFHLDLVIACRVRRASRLPRIL